MLSNGGRADGVIAVVTDGGTFRPSQRPLTWCASATAAAASSPAQPSMLQAS
jgi:hypothetical protein